LSAICGHYSGESSLNCGSELIKDASPDWTPKFEQRLFAPDGTFYLPDFTITWRGQEWYWEHLGMLDQEKYQNHWETKKAWYDKFFSSRLVITRESGNLSKDADALIQEFFS
jgi:exodeoxyribonuclease V alpha subunit